MQIKNWKKFQHYTRRNPPWIRLYRNLLDKKEWHQLDGESARILVNLWLVASEHEDGKLPDIDVLAFRLRLDSKVLAKSINKLQLFGFIENASTALAERKQDATSDQIRDIPEAETEADNSESEVSVFFTQFWSIYPRKKNVSKVKAKESWERQGLDVVGPSIIDAVQRLIVVDWANTEERFIPHPVTWLNQRRWETVKELSPSNDVAARASARYERIFGNEEG